MSGDTTIQALKRLSHLPERDVTQGDLIAGQNYYDVEFTGGTISNVTLDSVTFAGTNNVSGLQTETLGKLVAIGDSLLQNAIGIATTGTNGWSTYSHQRGFLNWFQALKGYPFNHTFDYSGNASPTLGNNVGIGGQQTHEMLARFQTDVLNQKPQVIWITAGTNDIKQAKTANNIFANIKQMAQLGLDSGAEKVLITTVFPRNNDDGNDFTVGEEAVRVALNTLLVAYGNNLPNKIKIFDCDAILKDGTGKLNSSYSYDGLHLNSNGAEVLATQLIIPWFEAIYGTDEVKRRKPSTYNPSTNPYGNLLVNPDFTGTGGTVSTGFSGAFPDSWRGERTAGSTTTAVASTVSQTDWNGDTINFINVVYSTIGTGTDPETVRVRPTATSLTTDIVEGQYYIGEVECILESTTGTNPIRSVYLEVRDQAGDDSFKRCFATAYTNGSVKDIFPTGQKRILLRTPPLRCDGATGITFYMYADVDGTVTGNRTVKWGHPTFIPVPAPDYGMNKTTSVHGAGTAYNLTATSAAVTLGTTSPTVTLPEAGKYLINCNAVIDYAGATFAANRTVTLKARRTNFTAADLTGGSIALTTGIVTTSTATFQVPSWSFVYDCTQPNEIVSLFGDVSVLPSAGNIQVSDANIVALRIP